MIFHSSLSFVVTGGPGAGKSTLIDALAQAGCITVEESGRAIIREQQTSGGRALPGVDPLRFAEEMVERDLLQHQAHRESTAPVYFDRGVPDTLGYLRLVGIAAPGWIAEAARTARYAPTVFVCPPWPAIYRHDAERTQSFDEARRTCDAVTAMYGELGYRLVEVPCVPVAERVCFAMQHVARRNDTW